MRLKNTSNLLKILFGGILFFGGCTYIPTNTYEWHTQRTEEKVVTTGSGKSSKKISYHIGTNFNKEKRDLTIDASAAIKEKIYKEAESIKEVTWKKERFFKGNFMTLANFKWEDTGERKTTTEPAKNIKIITKEYLTNRPSPSLPLEIVTIRGIRLSANGSEEITPITSDKEFRDSVRLNCHYFLNTDNNGKLVLSILNTGLPFNDRQINENKNRLEKELEEKIIGDARAIIPDIIEVKPFYIPFRIFTKTKEEQVKGDSKEITLKTYDVDVSDHKNSLRNFIDKHINSRRRSVSLRVIDKDSHMPLKDFSVSANINAPSKSDLVSKYFKYSFPLRRKASDYITYEQGEKKMNAGGYGTSIVFDSIMPPSSLDLEIRKEGYSFIRRRLNVDDRTPGTIVYEMEQLGRKIRGKVEVEGKIEIK